ncbi:hypothetical protein BT96DRAFT_942353 [Gymnopus androsaceus JB14]|uniref:Uncharacterized protein n=1 Tax=Gymnopus androsaceus JB14 TaxID=1447944 RepID=A0A6A4HB84_9AGAR|nr:hypothetical protein BT96DRAFT_942353 [Gymnopus androsaceus JB14]
MPNKDDHASTEDGNESPCPSTNPPTDTPADDPASINLTEDSDKEQSKGEAKKKEIKWIRDMVAKCKSNTYSFFSHNPDVEFDTDGKAKFIIYNCTICCAVVKVEQMLLQLCWGKETVDHVMAFDTSAKMVWAWDSL